MRIRWDGALLVASMGLGASACGGDGEAPRFVDPGPQVAVVAEPFLLAVIASDPDGDELDYGFSSPTLPSLREHAGITIAPNGQALFSWEPRADDLGEHLIDFIASDGDLEGRITVPFEVRAALGDGTAPVFRKPLGEGIFHDLSQSPDVPDIEIEVYDPDDAAVELSLQAPFIDDGTLEVFDDGLAGRFRWRPNEEQRAAAGTYELVLQADDGDNPPTLKRFTIVLYRGEFCPAQFPSITHSPVDVETLADPELLANVSDDVGLLAEPVLLWSTEPTEDPLQMERGFMDLVAGNLDNGTFRARPPNPAVPLGPGASATLYYRIAAVDEDGCLTNSPPEGLHQMTVTNPGGDGGGVCQPCSWDDQCGGADDLCVQLGVGTTACGRACSGPGQCDAGYACSDQPAVSVQGASGRQCLPTTGICDVDQCEDDGSEPNDTLQQALSQAPFEQGSLEGRVLCPLDDDWYRIELPTSAKVRALLSNALPVPDLDLMLTSAGGQIVGSSAGPDSAEAIDSECLPAGTYALRVYSIHDDPATYDLSYVLATSGC